MLQLVSYNASGRQRKLDGVGFVVPYCTIASAARPLLEHNPGVFISSLMAESCLCRYGY
jgi:hypothetical protein